MAGKLKLTGKLEETARKMLKDVCSVLRKNGIPYTLEGGTLLGIIRENRLLPWDNDMDITVSEDVVKELLSVRWKFWVRGYRTRIRRYREDIGPLKKGKVRLVKIQTRRFFIFKGVSLMDIFVKTEKDGKYYWIVGHKKSVLKSVPAHYYLKLREHEFDSFGYSVPSDTDGYLTCRYGDWKTPVKDYDFKKDDKAIVKQTEEK